MENKLTHFDNSGNARMVDVSEKKGTVRVAIAVSKIKMSKETLELIKQGKIGKGDVLGIVCNITQDKDIINLIKKTKEKFSKIDFWVNNAGINQADKLIWNLEKK